MNWCQIQVKWDSNDFGCQLIWGSIDLVVNRCVLQMILVVCWFELQVRLLSINLRFKWFGCQSIWDSSELVVNRFEIQVSWLSQFIGASNDFGWQVIWGSIDLVVNRCVLQMILVVRWLEGQLIWLSIDVCFKWFWLSGDLNFKWGGFQLIRDWGDSVVNWPESQIIWFSIDLGFKWVGCQLMCDSNVLVVTWCEIQVIWNSNVLKKFKWVGCQLMWDSSDLEFKCFEIQVSWLSTDGWSKLKLRRSKTKLFCETSFKIEALKLKNEAFLRDFLQKWSFEDQKPSISAKLPSKMKLWRSKTKHFCETSFKKEALKLKNEAFLRDFLQKCSFATQKRSFSARLPSKLKLKRSFSARLPSKLKLWRSKSEAFLRDFL